MLFSGTAGGLDETLPGAKPSVGAEEQTLEQGLSCRTR